MLLCCKTDLDPALLARAALLCSMQRREKAARILEKKARAASLTAGLLLDYCLKKSGIARPEIMLDPTGKPHLVGDQLFFSLSHSGEYAACALSKRPVGVDIQQVVEVSQPVIQRVCTPAERTALEKEADPRRAFIRLWALKESWLKASGVQVEEMFAAEFVPGEEISGPVGYRFWLSEQIEGYVLALCESE